MRKRNIVSLISSGFLLVLIILIPFVSANSTPQWFPDEETEIEYAIDHSIRMANGTDSYETDFDVLAWDDNLLIRPVHLRDLTGITDHSYCVSLANNTRLRIRIHYNSENATHYARTKTLIWDTGESNTSMTELRTITYEETSMYMQGFLNMEDEYIQRNYFPDGSEFFVDYINNELGAGEDLGISGPQHTGMTLISITSDSLVAYNHVGHSNYAVLTYIFGLDGRTQSFTSVHSGLMLGTVFVFNSTYGYSVIEGGSGWFSSLPWNWILIGVAGVELIIIVVFAVGKKRKK